MQARKFCSTILGMASLVGFLTATARADEAAAPPPEAAPVADPAAPPAGAAPAATASTAAASDSKMRVGLDLVPMPFGKIKGTDPTTGNSASIDAAFAFGLFPFFDYLITPNFFVGVAPQYTFNVNSKDGGGSAAKELDLLLRVGGGAPVADKFQVYGYVTPGYSIVMPSQGDSAKGFVIGAHVGGMMDLTSTLFLNLEVGYQLGFQKVSVGGTTIDFKTNYPQIGLGGGVRL